MAERERDQALSQFEAVAPKLTELQAKYDAVKQELDATLKQLGDL